MKCLSSVQIIIKSDYLKTHVCFCQLVCYFLIPIHILVFDNR